MLMPGAERLARELLYLLLEAGHSAFFSKKSLMELKMDVSKVARLVKETTADASLICTDPHPSFAWCRPTVAHIHWDPAPVVRPILRWSDNVARGRKDRRQTFTKAEFIEGGTIGPAPGNRALRDRSSK